MTVAPKPCDECAHWTGSMFSEYCRACCFGSKFEKKGNKAEPAKPLGRSCSTCMYGKMAPDSFPCRGCEGRNKWRSKYAHTDVDSMYPAQVYITTNSRAGGSLDYIKQMLNNVYGVNAIHDDDIDKALFHMSADWSKTREAYMHNRIPRITKVIFNHPATIVFWSDNTKTIVKASDDELFDAEKGLAMAISKKALGNQGNYYEEFKKWIPELEMRPLGEIDEAHEIGGEHVHEIAVQGAAEKPGRAEIIADFLKHYPEYEGYVLASVKIRGENRMKITVSGTHETFIYDYDTKRQYHEDDLK